jgi:hypothetical protein
MDNAMKNQANNRVKRAAAIKAEILEREEEYLDLGDLERATGMSLRQVEREASYLSDDGVIAQLFDKIA